MELDERRKFAIKPIEAVVFDNRCSSSALAHRVIGVTTEFAEPVLGTIVTATARLIVT